MYVVVDSKRDAASVGVAGKGEWLAATVTELLVEKDEHKVVLTYEEGGAEDKVPYTHVQRRSVPGTREWLQTGEAKSTVAGVVKSVGSLRKWGGHRDGVETKGVETKGPPLAAQGGGEEESVFDAGATQVRRSVCDRLCHRVMRSLVPLV